MDKKAVEASLEERFKYLKLITYLDEKAYGIIKEAKRVE
jgi:hypothetical protein